jgi:hypothetical protein
VSLQRRLFTAPWPAMLVISAVFLTGVSVLFSWVYELPWTAALWGGPAFAVLVTVAREVRQAGLRRQGRWEPMLAAGDALLAARVPADPAARAELVRMMPGQRMAVGGFMRWTWILFVVLALLQVPAALDRPRSWWLVGWFAVMAGAYAWWIPRNRRRVAAIDDALRSP